MDVYVAQEIARSIKDEKDLGSFGLTCKAAHEAAVEEMKRRHPAPDHAAERGRAMATGYPPFVSGAPTILPRKTFELLAACRCCDWQTLRDLRNIDVIAMNAFALIARKNGWADEYVLKGISEFVFN